MAKKNSTAQTAVGNLMDNATKTAGTTDKIAPNIGTSSDTPRARQHDAIRQSNQGRSDTRQHTDDQGQAARAEPGAVDQQIQRNHQGQDDVEDHAAEPRPGAYQVLEPSVPPCSMAEAACTSTGRSAEARRAMPDEDRSSGCNPPRIQHAAPDGDMTENHDTFV